MRVAVVGGGLAGLTAAYRLTRASADVTVFESADRPRGALRSVEVGGIRLPAGADAFWARKPAAVDLCRELGVQVASPATSGTWLWTEGGLVAYPTGTAFGIAGDPGDVLRWPGVSRAGRRRALADLLKARRKDAGDQTLGALLRRRLGDEVTDLAVGPLLTAPTAGDVDRMSIRACFPELERWEASQGSLIRGAQAANRAVRKGPDPGPMFVQPRGGVEALTEALTERLGEHRVRTGSRVTALGSLEADAIVLAVSASEARRLVASIAREAADDLDAIRAASVVVALLVYPEGTASALPDGTGFVAPRGKAPMRSSAWLSSRWPSPSFGTRAIMSCILGGAGDEDILHAADHEIAEACERHLAAVLPLPAHAEHAAVVRWPDAIPQYDLGHVERVARIRDHLPQGIFVVGQSYDGVDVPDVVRAAGEVAAAVIEGNRR